MSAELDDQAVVSLDAYRSTRAYIDRERATLDQVTLDLYCALRTCYLVMSDSRRKLWLPPLQMPLL
ncbi:hypothetical protein [Thermomonas sp.]|uniref:hypothetical protein n=1 Tax=Thermomonas sp. TaxID=1971895 RepID=UPI002486F846|nr:hypothetical protein [Thermomonas sp.]MDI1254121.1 hypothetical protein [Thermomonas sp.]